MVMVLRILIDGGAVTADKLGFDQLVCDESVDAFDCRVFRPTVWTLFAVFEPVLDARLAE